jgi:hypothetical protein
MVYDMASARFLASHCVTRRQRLLVNRWWFLQDFY